MSDTDNVEALIRNRYGIGDRFTANDIRVLLAEKGMRLTGHGGGAIFQHLKRRGVIGKTGHYRQSTNPLSRGNTLAVWRRVQ